MTRQERARKQAAVISRVYAEWAQEQKVTPDPQYAQSDPSQYPEHAELMSASPEAQTDLLERTRAALAQEDLAVKMEQVRRLALVKKFASTLPPTIELLLASGWRDQLRIPKGNGERSGRWTFTPWKHLDDVVSLLNSLGADQEPEVRAAVRDALVALDPFDASDFDPRDEDLQGAIVAIADTLENAPKAKDESVADAISQAAEGIRAWADTDWSLMVEDTDITEDIAPTLGRVVKNVWEGDLPSNTTVNPDFEDKTSQWLADELLRIKNHPVAPSPSARRKRAAYIKELNDRRDRDLMDPEELAHQEALKAIGFVRPTREEVEKAREYNNRISDLPAVREEDSEFPIDFLTAYVDSEENAVDYAVDLGYANRAGQRYGAKDPVTDAELDDWIIVQTARGLEGVLDGYGYDRDGNLYDHNKQEEESNDTPVSPELEALLDKWVQLRGSGTLTSAERVRLQRGVATEGEPAPGRLYRGANLKATKETWPRGRALDFGPSSASEDIGSALPYAENGEDFPVLFEFPAGTKGLNVQDRAERVGGYSEAEWITQGRFYVLGYREEDGVHTIVLSSDLPPDDVAQRNGRKPPITMDDLVTVVPDPLMEPDDPTDEPKIPPVQAELRGKMAGAKDLKEAREVMVSLLEAIDEDYDNLPSELPDLISRIKRDLTQDYFYETSGYAAQHMQRLIYGMDDDDPWKETLRYFMTRANDPWRWMSLHERRVIQARSNLLQHAYQASEVRGLVPSTARNKAMNYIAALRGELAGEVQVEVLYDDDAMVTVGDSLFEKMYNSFKTQDPIAFGTALKGLVDLADARPDGDGWKKVITSIDDVVAEHNWLKYFEDDPDMDDPEFDRLLRALPEATDAEAVAQLVRDLETLNQKMRKGGYTTPFGYSTLPNIATAIRQGDTSFLDRSVEDALFRLDDPNVDEKWRQFSPILVAVRDTWMHEFEMRYEMAYADLVEKHGTLPDFATEPSTIVGDIGMFYTTRTSGTANCVLASAAYELRRRGLDVHPQRTKKGRNSEEAHRRWFTVPWGDDPTHTVTRVEGLKGRRKKARYEMITAHIADHHPPGSRGTIRVGWKGLRYGHIWNWEINEDGSVEYWDPQPGEKILPDSSYWQDCTWDAVVITRLDHLTLKPDVDVLTAPPEVVQQITPEMRVVARQLAEVRQQRQEIFARLRKIDVWSEKYSEIRALLQPLDKRLSELRESPEAKALAKVGNEFPILPDDKNTL